MNTIHINEWGQGNPKIAILIHGLASSSQTWKPVAEELANHGYHVFAPDLAGHGDSLRRKHYSVHSWANDIIKHLPSEPDLAVGHSLGGLILAKAHSRLQPKKTIFSDPAFFIPIKQFTKNSQLRIFSKIFLTDEKTMRKRNPVWDDKDIATELKTLASWDMNTVKGIYHSKKIIENYLENPGKAIILTSHRSILVPKFMVKTFINKHKIQVKKIIGSGHMIHRDKFSLFMENISQFNETKTTTIPIKI